jgi:hypothetical protein
MLEKQTSGPYCGRLFVFRQLFTPMNVKKETKVICALWCKVLH